MRRGAGGAGRGSANAGRLFLFLVSFFKHIYWFACGLFVVVRPRVTGGVFKLGGGGGRGVLKGVYSYFQPERGIGSFFFNWYLLVRLRFVVVPPRVPRGVFKLGGGGGGPKRGIRFFSARKGYSRLGSWAAQPQGRSFGGEAFLKKRQTRRIRWLIASHYRNVDRRGTYST